MRDFGAKLEQARSLQLEEDASEELGGSMEIAPDCPVAKEVMDLQRHITEMILDREQVVGDIRKMSADVRSIQMSKLLSSLTEVRGKNLEVVEAVVRWRELCGNEERVFVWKAHNYLLCILTDLNFLAEVPAIVNTLGVSATTMRNNPFMSPYTLLPGSLSPAIAAAAGAPHPGRKAVDEAAAKVAEPASEPAPDAAGATATAKARQSAEKPLAEPGSMNAQEARVARAEQVIMREIKLNDMRALETSQRRRMQRERAEGPASPVLSANNSVEALSKWREDAQCQMRGLAESWGLPEGFSEVRKLPTVGSGLVQELRAAGVRRQKRARGKRSKTTTIKLVYPSRTFNTRVDSTYRAVTSVPGPRSPTKTSVVHGSRRSKCSRPGSAAADLSAYTEASRSVAGGVPESLLVPVPRMVPVSAGSPDAPLELSASDVLALGQQEQPGTDVVLVVAAVLTVLAPGNKVPSLFRWQVFRESLLAGDGRALVGALAAHRQSKLATFKLRALAPFLADERFSPAALREHNVTLAALCAWVINACIAHPSNRHWIAKNGGYGAARQAAERIVSEEAAKAKAIPEREPPPDEPEPAELADDLDVDSVTLGARILSLNLSQPNGVYMLSFFMASCPRGALVIKCYDPSDSSECRSVLAEQECVRLSKRMHMPVYKNQAEIKLFCRALQSRIRVHKKDGLELDVCGLGKGCKTRWIKAYGTARMYSRSKFAISVFVDSTQPADKTDLLFKAKDALRPDTLPLYYKLSRTEAAAVLVYSKQLMHESLLQDRIEALLQRMRMRPDKDGIVAISFVRNKPMHNPHGLEHPSQPDQPLNFHDDDLALLAASEAPEKSKKKSATTKAPRPHRAAPRPGTVPTGQGSSRPRATKPPPVKAAPKPIKAAPKPAKAAPKPAKAAPKPIKAAPKPAKKAPEPVKKAPEPAKKAPEPVKKVPEPVKKVPEPAKKAPEPVKTTPELAPESSKSPVDEPTSPVSPGYDEDDDFEDEDGFEEEDDDEFEAEPSPAPRKLVEEESDGGYSEDDFSSVSSPKGGSTVDHFPTRPKGATAGNYPSESESEVEITDDVVAVDGGDAEDNSKVGDDVDDVDVVDDDDDDDDDAYSDSAFDDDPKEK